MKLLLSLCAFILLFAITKVNALNNRTFTLHPSATPIINTQPLNYYTCIPGTVTFFVTASATSGLDGLRYQWYKNGNAIGGATASSLTLTNVQSGDTGAGNVYRVDVIEYVLIGILFPTTLPSNDVYINLPIPNSATLPATQSIVTGNTTFLGISAASAAGAFQWYKDGVAIAAATTSIYIINPINTKDNGTYVIHAAVGCGADILSANSILHTDSIVTSSAAGNINSVTTWLNSAGTSRPVDFTRPEHVFNMLSTRATASTLTNLKIAGTLDLINTVTTITSATTLNVGVLLRTGTGSLSGDSTTNLILNGTSSLYLTPGKSMLDTLTISTGTTTLNTLLTIYGTAGKPGTLINNSFFNTNDSLVLKSTAITTSTIGKSSGLITGKVCIERYIPARRAWRLMAVPITNIAAPTINAAWQEGATNSSANPNAGYGTWVTGGAATAGFDRSPTNTSSLKYYNGSALVPVSNTYTGAITDKNSYFVFVRGNRSGNIATALSTTPATITNLRMTGNVNQGTQTIAVAAGTSYSLIGNPFASTIDWPTLLLTSTNIADRYYMWDPQIGGTYQVGGYVLVQKVGAVYTYVPSVAAVVTNVTTVIQSGQSVFVQSAIPANPGSIVINESAKLGLQNTVPFGRVAGSENSVSNIVMNLMVVNADSSLSTLDGVLMTYNGENNNNVDIDDAAKFFNINENFYIQSSGSTLMLESRKLPALLDTVKLKLLNLTANNYQFLMSLNTFTAVNLQPLLYDKYLQTSTVIDSTMDTKYPFNINNDSLSKVADRFSITYRKITAPVKFLNIQATVFNLTSVAVDWKIEREVGIVKYELLKADEKDSFRIIATIPAINNANGAAYSYNDLQLNTYKNKYKIKATDLNGVITYSEIVNGTLQKTTGSITIWPNPTVGKIITLSIENLGKGIHNYHICNSVGATVYSGIINNTNGQLVATINMPESTATGIYQLLINNGGLIEKINFIVGK